MNAFEAKLRVARFLKAALECSIYHAPTEPGLTYSELLEVGSRVGLQPGEIADAMDQVADRYFGGQDDRLQLRPDDSVMLAHFMGPEEPDYRNLQAFDFVFTQLSRLPWLYARMVISGCC